MSSSVCQFSVSSQDQYAFDEVSSIGTSRQHHPSASMKPMLLEEPASTSCLSEEEIAFAMKSYKLGKLYHAATCPSREYECKDNHHCFAARRLFHHMIKCKEGMSCSVPGCFKSRRIWSHYRRCASSACKVCVTIPMTFQDMHKAKKQRN